MSVPPNNLLVEGVYVSVSVMNRDLETIQVSGLIKLYCLEEPVYLAQSQT
jgi:hypothetical protein